MVRFVSSITVSLMTQGTNESQQIRSSISAPWGNCSRRRRSREPGSAAGAAPTVPLPKCVPDLQRGGDIRRITLGELASHTSGLPDHPGQYERWHRGKYTWPDFVRFLNSWKADPKHEPGKQYLYSNAAMVLLRVALERRFNTRFAALIHQRITAPLGMSSTALPLPRDLLGRAVQGYGQMGKPIGRPGEESGVFEWPGAGQIYSSPRDMATFLAAN